MCLDDKEIITSIEYSEQAKEYRNSLKRDVKEMVMNTKNYSPTIDNGIFYCKGREDMKKEILKLCYKHQASEIASYIEKEIK